MLEKRKYFIHSQGYSSSPSNVRDYSEYTSSYLNGKPSYSTELGSTSYITGGSSPYAKSDSRHYSSDSSGDSTDPRSSLSSSFYKTKYGNDAVINALRPTTSFHTSSSSGSAPSSDLSSSGHYGNDYSSGSSTHPSTSYYTGSSSGSNAGLSSSSASSSSSSADYSPTNIFGERQPQDHQVVRGSYATSSGGAEAQQQVDYSQAARPLGSIYAGYSGSSGLATQSDYTQSRPTTYSHGGDYVLSSGSSGHHPSSHHHHHHQPTQSASGYSHGSDDYASSLGGPHGYKTYVMNNGGSATSSSSYPSKYQSVFGAIKNFFGVGGHPDASSSASHVPSYPSAPSSSPYYSSSMHTAGHHAHASAAGAPSYYFTSGSGASSPQYSKSYPPMRLVSGYGGAGGSPNGNSKIIVIRDSGSVHGSGYPSSAGSILGSPSSFSAKNRISAFASGGAGPSYVSSQSPTSLSYANAPHSSSSFPASYSSSGSFGGGHGGSSFLGYST